MSSQEILLIPGPTQLHPEIALAMARPMVYHRSPEFAALLTEVQKGLKYLFQTEQPVISLSASGTGAMEAAVANFFSPGDRVLVIVGGKFGERWAEMTSAYGLDVQKLEVPWGEAADLPTVRRLLSKLGNVKGLFVQACETSTGVKHPVKELAEAAHEVGAMIVVDAVSALGVFDLPMDKWGIDIMVAGSQKGMMLPPGLSFVAAGERAWREEEKAALPRYYFALKKERNAQIGGQTAYTPAVPLFYALQVGLRHIMEEGLEHLFARLAVYAEASRRAMEAIGLEPFSAVAAETVTTVKVPPGIDGSALLKYTQQKCHIRIAGGQGKLKGKIFRIGHVGFLRPSDILAAISAIEMALADFGYPFEGGAGVSAAEEVFRLREKGDVESPGE